MPFSNDKGEGFENKIAEIVAGELKVPVEYTWFPQATGFIRQTLFAKRCDVVMGYAQGDELVLNTNPYYRSTYALVYRPGAGLDGVDTPRGRRACSGKRIGVVAGTPPATIMAGLGLIQQAKPYPLMVDRRYDLPGERMIGDIRSGDIDAGVLWGPMAGYFAARGGDKLAVVPLTKEAAGARMAYRITFGVRQLEDDWKRQLNAADRQAAGRYRRRAARSSACRCSTSNPISSPSRGGERGVWAKAWAQTWQSPRGWRSAVPTGDVDSSRTMRWARRCAVPVGDLESHGPAPSPARLRCPRVNPSCASGSRGRARTGAARSGPAPRRRAEATAGAR